ncbi:MAG: hypothetical protein IPK81_14075 [Rhodospirillales bacterium]|nr:MAG: hypothetical protein IPK81_14075 [Rhodospirillales bacterium]
MTAHAARICPAENSMGVKTMAKIARAKAPKVPTLRKLVDMVSAVIETRNSIPVLGAVLLTPRADGASELRATDMDSTVTVACAIAAAAPALLNAKALSLAVDKATSAELAPGNMMTHAAAGRLVDVGAVDCAAVPSDFPMLATDQQWTGGATFRAGALAESLAWIAPCISREETRYYLNGVYFHADPDSPATLKMVATDGHRLKIDSLACPDPDDFACGDTIIVPRRAVDLIIRACGLYGPEESVRLDWNAARIQVSIGPFGAVTIDSKVIDGTFPAYDRVIGSADAPAVSIVFAPADRPAFVAAWKAHRAASGRSKVDVVRVSRAAGAYFPGQGNDAPGEVAYNAGYLNSMLCDDSVVLSVPRNIDTGAPAFDSLTRVTYPAHPRRLGVLMPMRDATPPDPTPEDAAWAATHGATLRAERDGERDRKAAERAAAKIAESRLAPDYTPWGRAQSTAELAPGIWHVGTPSHGGFRVADHLVAEMDSRLPGASAAMGRRDAGDWWFEEDCDWAAVALAWPELFKPADVDAAHRTARRWRAAWYFGPLVDSAPEPDAAHFVATPGMRDDDWGYAGAHATIRRSRPVDRSGYQVDGPLSAPPAESRVIVIGAGSDTPFGAALRARIAAQGYVVAAETQGAVVAETLYAVAAE